MAASGKVALIAGATGQDGAYLAEFLLSKGYTVHGIKRRSSSFNTERIDHLIHDPHEEGGSFHLHYGDVTDATNIIRIVQETKPDEIYNLAAQSHVQVSFETPEYTANANGLGTLRLLKFASSAWSKTVSIRPDLRAVGKAQEISQGNDLFYPRFRMQKQSLHMDHGQLHRVMACMPRTGSCSIMKTIRGETFVTQRSHA
jgi:GDPmannose 4,6-dehydratase